MGSFVVYSDGVVIRVTSLCSTVNDSEPVQPNCGVSTRGVATSASMPVLLISADWSAVTPRAPLSIEMFLTQRSIERARNAVTLTVAEPASVASAPTSCSLVRSIFGGGGREPGGTGALAKVSAPSG